MNRSLFLSSIIALTLVACGSDDGETKAATTGGTAATGSGGGSATGGATTGTTGAGTGGGATAGLDKVGSYVVLGDSISDHGGTGPYFNDLLAANNDAMYPEWDGKDLKSKYGVDLQVVINAQGGAVSADLPDQVAALPASLPGPVVVTITIGGNDMQAAIIQILDGTDQPAQDKFRANIKAAITELTTPGRFGDGVLVHVFEADIYDPTDGGGDFSACPAPLSFVPEQPTDPFFANWNGVASDEVAKYPYSLVAPLHATFHEHGINSADPWFYTDCIHPNSIGHNEIRAMFWKAITGESGP